MTRVRRDRVCIAKLRHLAFAAVLSRRPSSLFARVKGSRQTGAMQPVWRGSFVQVN